MVSIFLLPGRGAIVIEIIHRIIVTGYRARRPFGDCSDRNMLKYVVFCKIVRTAASRIDAVVFGSTGSAVKVAVPYSYVRRLIFPHMLVQCGVDRANIFDPRIGSIGKQNSGAVRWNSRKVK